MVGVDKILMYVNDVYIITSIRPTARYVVIVLINILSYNFFILSYITINNFWDIIKDIG